MQSVNRSFFLPDYGNELEYLRSYVKMLRKKIEGRSQETGVRSQSQNEEKSVRLEL
ncbi:MAG TPA: hypothetical protein VKM93_16885 [Terriglobia bacterium]|nr:hypothetical protein [Terriglobia bacterium]